MALDLGIPCQKRKEVYWLLAATRKYQFSVHNFPTKVVADRFRICSLFAFVVS